MKAKSRKRKLIAATLAVILLLTAAVSVFVPVFLYNTPKNRAAEYILSPQDINWSRQVSNCEPYSREESADFVYGDGYMSVGNWSCGDYAARFLSRPKLKITDGTFSGEYKTENAFPGQTEIVIFYKDIFGQNLRNSKYHLDETDGTWKTFSAPVKYAPAGTWSVQVGIGTYLKNDAVLSFRNLKVSAEPMEIDFTDYSDGIYRLPDSVALPQTGKWRINKDSNGYNWLVTPHGEPFYSLGLDIPYLKDSLIGPALSEFKNMNFNTLGGWTHSRVGKFNTGSDSPEYMMFAIQTTGLNATFEYVKSADGEKPGAHTMADPFDDRWFAAYKKRIETIKNDVGDSKYLIGYFIDNEVDHTDLYRKVYSKYCSEVFLSWLQKKYTDVAELNTAWDKTYSSFDDILKYKPDPRRRAGAMYEDFNAFKKVIADKYAERIMQAYNDVYNNDPPLLFCRFALNISDILDIMDVYTSRFDAFAINCYPENLAPGLSDWQKSYLGLLYEMYDVPILLSEWSVPAFDSGRYGQSRKGQDFSVDTCIATQADRTAQAKNVYTDHFNLPYLVGSHWFAWLDHGKKYYDRVTNRGLFHEDGITPYPEIQDMFKILNSKLRLVFEKQ